MQFVFMFVHFLSTLPSGLFAESIVFLRYLNLYINERMPLPPAHCAFPFSVLQRVDQVLHMDAHGMAGADLVPL